MALAKKRGRPAKAAPQVKEKIIVQTIEVAAPILDGYELYAKLRETGYFQGGSGHYIEDQYGTDKVYVPTVPEVISSLSANPDMWEKMRDGVVRAYIGVFEDDGYEY